MNGYDPSGVLRRNKGFLGEKVTGPTIMSVRNPLTKKIVCKKCMANYNKVILYQKVGYIFEQYNDYLNLSASFFDHLQEHLTNQVKYFLNDDYDNVEYNAKWKVIAPSNLRNKLREGL